MQQYYKMYYILTKGYKNDIIKNMGNYKIVI